MSQDKNTGNPAIKYFEIDATVTQPRKVSRNGSMSHDHSKTAADASKKDANFLYGRYST